MLSKPKKENGIFEQRDLGLYCIRNYRGSIFVPPQTCVSKERQWTNDLQDYIIDLEEYIKKIVVN